MTRTAQQIHDRIKELYPAVWVAQTPEEGLAVYQGIAKVFELCETVVDAFVLSAQVLEAEGNRVDLHAKGRGLVRGEMEPDEALQARIRSWADQVTKPSLETGINAVLTTKGAYIEEHLPDGCYGDRLAGFLDRSYRIFDDCFNIFTAFVPWQVAGLILNAFADRASYADRQNAFMDDLLFTDISIYKRVYQYIDDNRAAGVRFNLVIE